MIGLPAVYLLGGLLFVGFAGASLRAPGERRRATSAAFFALVALSFLFGDGLGDLGQGVVALLLVGLGARGFGGRSGTAGGPEAARATARRQAGAARHGDRLFLLVLIVPAVAVIGGIAFKSLQHGPAPLVDPKQATLVALALGVVLALAAAMAVLRAGPGEPLAGGAELARTVGWAFILPQMLAALGVVLALSGVGHAVSDLAERIAPADNRLAMVALYTGGMALFTLVMGNAFAAFPVMTAGVGVPIIVHRLHGDPAILGSLGMLSGFCGTLLTPMAANFNVVPVQLLELPDRWAVIRAQAPSALLLLGVNTALMYALVFRF